jgi:microcystin-dependent protein
MSLYLGTIVTFACQFNPQKFEPCDGTSTLSIQQYEGLYSSLVEQGLIPQAASDATTFSMPDLSSRAPANTTSQASNTGTYPPNGIPPAYDLGGPYASMIAYTTASTAPSGWLVCDGSELPIAQNTALFSLLGVTFGGNGVKTFDLPSLLDDPTTPSGSLPLICSYGVFPSHK